MKYLAGFLTLIVAITFFLLPQIARADSSSTVCCNGKCTTSDSSNVNVQDNNGNCHIQFGNNTQTVSPTVIAPTVTPEPTEENTNGVTLTPVPTATPTPVLVFPTASPEATITPDPTIMQMRKDINNQVEKQVQTLKEHLKNQDHELSVFFHSSMDTLQSFLKGLFK